MSHSKDPHDNKETITPIKGPAPVPLPTTSHIPTSIAGISLIPTPLAQSTNEHHHYHYNNNNSSAPSTATTTTSTRRSSSTLNQVVVDALGELLESASVHSLPDAQDQRRKQNYKSTAIISKTLKQSQEERRRQALAEQAKKRYQFVNHARKLALFSSGQQVSDGSESESESEEEEEDGGEDVNDDEEGDGSQDDDDDDDEQAEENRTMDKEHGVRIKNGKKRAKELKSTQQVSAVKATHVSQGQEASQTTSMPLNHKRRLSSGTESDTSKSQKAGGRDGGVTGDGSSAARRDSVDALSPKKPRLQKRLPKAIRKKKRDRNPFSDQLMMHEVMTEIPTDLDSSYYIVPLPIGHRCFVISADGKTIARLPSGQLLVAPFESCLPAGSPQYRGNRRSDYCILDCVYSSVTRTFWTLDIMCWRGHPVYECETEFRFWWLRGKLAEIETLQQKWMAAQVKEWETGQAKKRNRRARQAKKKQDKAAAATAATAGSIAAGAMDVSVPDVTSAKVTGAGAPSTILDGSGSLASVSGTKVGNMSSLTKQKQNGREVDEEGEDGDDGDDEAGLESMEMEDLEQRSLVGNSSIKGTSGKGKPSETTKFWPVVFTPLPYFNASMDVIRLLAESMYQPHNILHTSPTSQPTLPSLDTVDATTVPLASSTVSGRVMTSHANSHITSILPQTDRRASISGQSQPPSPSQFGSMALSGELATAASLFPAHDNTQRARQDKTLAFEQAAGLVFFNKKTIYVLGVTPLCGWVSIEQIDNVFFGEEGGVGPVPGTFAVEGREVEMEDALERIRI